MKSLLVAAAVACAAFGVSTAEAAPAFPAWTCKLAAVTKGFKAAAIVGVTALEGVGQVKCVSAIGQKSERPAYVVITSVSVGPQAVLPSQLLPFVNQTTTIVARSVGAGLSSVDAMFGDFTLQAGYGAQIGEISGEINRDVVSFTPRIPNGSISTGFSANLQIGGSLGLGVNKHLTAMMVLTPAQYAAYKLKQENNSFDKHGAVH